jgi:maleate cis-trans isomerase
MNGFRARIGYTSPLFLTESFPYEFYKVVPDGVRLVLTTLAIHLYSDEEVRKSIEITLDAARKMGKAGVDLVILGGVPLNLSLGYDGLERTMRALELEIGVPVTSSLSMQIKALRTLGARKVAVGFPIPETKSIYGDYLSHYGFELAGQMGIGRTVATQAMITPEMMLELGRTLHRDFPTADTLYFPSPHWGTTSMVETIEAELGVNVVSATQAIIWDALRRCNVCEAIPGRGRLFARH